MVLPTGAQVAAAQKRQRLEFPVAIGGAADMSGRADQPDTNVNDPLETLAGLNFHSAGAPECAPIRQINFAYS
jgi:hypothetical protein